MNAPIELAIDSMLTEVQNAIRRGEGQQAIAMLCGRLWDFREQLSESEFRGSLVPRCRQHPLFEWIQEDPYCRRAYQKPRGYAGDAEMLDYLYAGVPDAETTEIGRVVFEGTTRTSNGRSVVERRDRLAHMVDECSEEHAPLCVISLAAGHLPEASVSRALQRGGIGSWIAIDQDAQSLDRIRDLHPSPIIETLQASVVDVLRGKVSLPSAHVIYSSGLFDYLPDRLASKTIATLFRHLLPRGRLVISNFHPRSSGRHFMDIFMDWNLIYRDENDLLRLLGDLPDGQSILARTHTDSLGNIVYLSVDRN